MFRITTIVAAIALLAAQTSAFAQQDDGRQDGGAAFGAIVGGLIGGAIGAAVSRRGPRTPDFAPAGGGQHGLRPVAGRPGTGVPKGGHPGAPMRRKPGK